MADWDYEKYDEKGEKIWLPINDYDGKITGKIVMNTKAYFDENPEEAKRLGWIKHIHRNREDIKCDSQTQYIIWGTKAIDEYTIEDTYYIMDKSEEQMELEELLDYKINEMGGIRFM